MYLKGLSETLQNKGIIFTSLINNNLRVKSGKNAKQFFKLSFNNKKMN